MKFNSIIDFFLEIESNYENKYNNDKNNPKFTDKNNRINNNWYYRNNLVDALNEYIGKEKIYKLGHHIDYGFMPFPPATINKITIIILPKYHSRSCGVYLNIKRLGNKINIDFTYSVEVIPPPKIKKFIDELNKIYGIYNEINDLLLDSIVNDKITQFIEISNKFDFKSMKTGQGQNW